MHVATRLLFAGRMHWCTVTIRRLDSGIVDLPKDSAFVVLHDIAQIVRRFGQRHGMPLK
jgi:hypothetical protein